MNDISQVFDLLDDWRHFPDYQLERRADVFFAVCLPAFLSSHLKLDIRPQLIPEFPVRIGTINTGSKSNQSCKIDYLALDATGQQAFFLELKTDSGSRRAAQDKYLAEARIAGLPTLLDGVLKLVCASDHKHKYCRLLRLLERHRLILLPDTLDAALSSRHYRSAVNKCLPHVKVIAQPATIRTIYVQPKAIGGEPGDAGFVYFEDLAAWLDQKDGEFARRFAQSLRSWSASPAGQ